MNKKRKGYTLVEVLVSIVVFTIIVLSLLSTYIGMRKIVHRQEEYIRLEMVAHDINYYWDMYGTEWDKKFFNHDPLTDSFGYHGYLDKAFSTDSISADTHEWSAYDFPYIINYRYEEIDGITFLIISEISSRENDQRIFMDNLNCGESAYEFEKIRWNIKITHSDHSVSYVKMNRGENNTWIIPSIDLSNGDKLSVRCGIEGEFAEVNKPNDVNGSYRIVLTPNAEPENLPTIELTKNEEALDEETP